MVSYCFKAPECPGPGPKDEAAVGPGVNDSLMCLGAACAGRTGTCMPPLDLACRLVCLLLVWDRGREWIRYGSCVRGYPCLRVQYLGRRSHVALANVSVALALTRAPVYVYYAQYVCVTAHPRSQPHRISLLASCVDECCGCAAPTRDTQRLHPLHLCVQHRSSQLPTYSPHTTTAVELTYCRDRRPQEPLYPSPPVPLAGVPICISLLPRQ